MKEDIRVICRRFRKNQTKAEKSLWKLVRNRQIDGFKILRQYPIGFEWNKQIRFFIADFCCHKMKLVIEIDGGIHENQKDYDKMREQIIGQLGYRIIRFSNDEVLYHIEDVIEKLKNTFIRNNSLPFYVGEKGLACRVVALAKTEG
jgi:very-short-patch-repair endonuclease